MTRIPRYLGTDKVLIGFPISCGHYLKAYTYTTKDGSYAFGPFFRTFAITIAGQLQRITPHV
jgi:hypothetical protein